MRTYPGLDSATSRGCLLFWVLRPGFPNNYCARAPSVAMEQTGQRGFRFSALITVTFSPKMAVSTSQNISSVSLYRPLIRTSWVKKRWPCRTQNHEHAMSSCRHLDGGFKVLRLGKAKQVWTAAGRRDPLELACLPHRGYAFVNSLELGVPPGQFLISVGWDTLG